MSFNAKPLLKQDANDSTKQWIEFAGQEGMTATPLQYTLTPQQFSAFQAAGLTATRESNNPLYYNQGAFSDAALTRINQLATPLSGGIGDVGQQAQSRQYLTDWTNILGQYQTKLPTATPVTLADPYSDKNLWAKTPYMGGSQVTYIGPKGGPSDPDKGGLSNVQAPANIQQAGSQVPTAASIQAELNKILSGLGGTKNPQTGQMTITAEELSKATGTPLQVPTPTTAGVNPNAVVAGAEQTSKSIQDYINMLTPTNSAEQTKYNEILGQLEGLIPSAGGKGTAQLEAEKAAGIETLKTNLANINGQIQTKLAEYKALATQISGKPITVSSIIGAEAQIQKAMASDIGLLQAQALGIQGNLSVAQESVNRAIDLRFSDVESEINIRLQQLKLLEPELTKSEQRRSEAIQLYLNQQNQLIADQKAEQKQIQSVMLTAATNGAPNNILSSISNASNYEQAIQLANPYLQKQQEQWTSPYLMNGEYVQRNSQTGEIRKLSITGGGGGDNIVLPEGTPAETANRQQILNILSNKGSKIGQGTKTKISDALNVMNAVEDLSNLRQTEKFTGISPLNTLLDIKIPFTDIGLVPFRESLRSAAGRENTGYIEAINLKVQQWASGAALTTAQTEQVGRFTPTVSDTDAAVRTKLNNLYNFMLTQVQGNLQSEGIDFVPERANLFELYEMIQKASSEQLTELKNQGLIK